MKRKRSTFRRRANRIPLIGVHNDAAHRVITSELVRLTLGGRPLDGCLLS